MFVKEVKEDWKRQQDHDKQNDWDVDCPAAAFAIPDYVLLELGAAVDAAVDETHVDSSLMMSHQGLLILVQMAVGLPATSVFATASILPLAATQGCFCWAAFDRAFHLRYPDLLLRSLGLLL